MRKLFKERKLYEEIRYMFILTLVINLWFVMSLETKTKGNESSLKEFMLTYKSLGENFPFIAQLLMQNTPS